MHPSLSEHATTSRVFNHLTNASLLCIGQLCDDDCVAISQKRLLRIYKNRKCMISGKRNRQDGLWDISLPISDSTNEDTSLRRQSMNVIIKKDQSKSDLASYLYACCGSPPVSAFLRAARNENLITWPGIDDIASKKYLSPSIASAKGHLNQEPTNPQSTKADLPQDDLDSFPPLNNPDVRTSSLQQ